MLFCSFELHDVDDEIDVFNSSLCNCDVCACETANELFVKLEQSKALPTLSSFVNFGYAGFGEDFDFTKKDQKPQATLPIISFDKKVFLAPADKAKFDGYLTLLIGMLSV